MITLKVGDVLVATTSYAPRYAIVKYITLDGHAFAIKASKDFKSNELIEDYTYYKFYVNHKPGSEPIGYRESLEQSGFMTNDDKGYHFYIHKLKIDLTKLKGSDYDLDKIKVEYPLTYKEAFKPTSKEIKDGVKESDERTSTQNI